MTTPNPNPSSPTNAEVGQRLHQLYDAIQAADSCASAVHYAARVSTVLDNLRRVSNDVAASACGKHPAVADMLERAGQSAVALETARNTLFAVVDAAEDLVRSAGLPGNLPDALSRQDTATQKLFTAVAAFVRSRRDVMRSQQETQNDEAAPIPPVNRGDDQAPVADVPRRP